MPQDELLIRIGLLLGIIVLLLFFILRARMRSKKRQTGGANNHRNPGHRHHKPYIGADPDTEEQMLEIWRIAFDAKQFSYTILGEHEKVLNLVRESIPDAISSRKYFPRRPMIIPRLMAAMRNDDSTLRELVDIISEDPVLTGDVLRLANSSLYKVSKEPVETVARAVVLLGTDGLRSVIANSVMQPVFKVPTGYYENFAPLIWDLASRSAMAAQAWARSTKKCNGFNAHLVTLIHHISYIVLFKLTADLYHRASGSLPRPEVFTHIFEEQVDRVARLIAEDWELSEGMHQAFSEFDMGLDAEQLSPLARAAYLGRVAGLGSSLHARGKLQEADVWRMLESKGVTAMHAAMMWQPDMEFPALNMEL